MNESDKELCQIVVFLLCLFVFIGVAAEYGDKTIRNFMGGVVPIAILLFACWFVFKPVKVKGK